FEPFERGSPEAEGGELKGLGLGLAVVRRYVEAHGGSVTVEPSALGGSRFTIVVPAGGAPSRKPAPSPEAISAPGPAPSAHLASGRALSRRNGGVAGQFSSRQTVREPGSSRTRS